jgi:GGDEF domain-containing protein
MLPGPPRRRRARPVADAPIDSLASRSEDLTKGWLLALVEQAPLEQAPDILAADLSRDGPRICQAVLRAIADDAEQHRLEPGGDLVGLVSRVGELAGAGGPDGTSQAVDALQAITWVALRSALPDPDPDLITALAERLTQVTELIRAAALRAGARPAAGSPPPPRSRGESRPVRAEAPSGVEAKLSEVEPTRQATDEAKPSEVEPTPQAADEAKPSEVEPTPQAEDEPMPPPPVAGRPRREQAGPLDTRAWVADGGGPPEGDVLWVRALEEQIERADGASVALVVAELEDADRMLVVESPPVLAAAYGEFATAVRDAVRRQDILVYENDARAWIIAPQTGRSGAYALRARISEAVHNGRPWRGAPMVASVGVAVLGDDGSTAEQLIDAAEQARFAAAARGIAVMRPTPDGSHA